MLGQTLTRIFRVTTLGQVNRALRTAFDDREATADM
jgi:hypothetical protein